MEEIVPNLSPLMCVNVFERKGRLCVSKSVERGYIGTLTHSSFRWRGARTFNALPPKIRNLSNCESVMCYCSSVSLTITYLYYLTFHVLQIRITASQEQW